MEFAILAKSVASGRPILCWRIPMPGCPGCCLWISEAHATCDVSRRSLNNGFALIWQVAGNPCTVLRLSACCDFQQRARARSCRSSGVRRTRFRVMFVPAVLAADLLLAMSARDLGAGLLALLLWGRVFPALAGLGRGKVNWKVPPIARVCGERGCW